jgi:hypothetical protein
MKVGEGLEESTPDGPGFFAGSFLVDFFQFGSALGGKEGSFPNASGESIA